MSTPFVWFDNLGPQRARTAEFLSANFGWTENDIGPMTFLAEGKGAPFAATCDAMPELQGWVPYVEVEDLASAVARARDNGAVVLAEDMPGPAGVATFIKDPGGAPLALWKREEGM